ncbi:MAG TPA: hypothetical protein VEJ63_02250 [Planctomycetota bacterium]|nr:hypothetical protein [Planctomycetota bacterium]
MRLTLGIPSLLVFLLSASPARAIQDVPREDLWTTDGRVTAMRERNGILYIAGSFGYVGPKNGPVVFCDTAGAGSVKPGPRFTSWSHACESDGNGGWFIVGILEDENGLRRSGLYHILPDGSVDPDFNHPGSYYRLKLARGVLYASAVGPANGVAAIDPTTGMTLPWRINISGVNSSDIIQQIEVVGDTLYIVGSFESVEGVPRTCGAAIDIPTRTVSAWNPQVTPTSGTPMLYTIAVGSGSIFVGGNFNAAEGQPRNGLAAYDAASGALTAFDAGAVSTGSPIVRSMDFDNGTLYVGGNFQQIGGASRSNLAALDTATGLATAWRPTGVDPVSIIKRHGTTIYTVRSTFSSFAFPDASKNRVAGYSTITAAATGFSLFTSTGVRGIAAQAGSICLVGDVLSVGGMPRKGAAAIDLATGQATSWAPEPPFGFWLPSAMEIIGSKVFVATASGLRAFDLDTAAAITLPSIYSAEITSLLSKGTVLYATGSFSSFGGQPRQRLAAIDTATNTLLPISLSVTGATIYGIDTANDVFYLGGDFTAINGVGRDGIAAVDASGNLLDLNPVLQDPAGVLVRTVHVKDNLLFFGGRFSSVNDEPANNLSAVYTRIRRCMDRSGRIRLPVSTL